MKWSNPERLSLYGVRMIGWPPDIPAANPSSLKSSQNQRLLELVEQGELRFEKTMMTGMETLAPVETMEGTSSTAEDFSWAYDADGNVGASLAPAAAVADTAPVGLPPSSSPGDAGTYSWKGPDEDLLDEYGFEVGAWGDGEHFEGLGAESPVERRVRKRARSPEEDG
jgi:hypothetical protein